MSHLANISGALNKELGSSEDVVAKKRDELKRASSAYCVHKDGAPLEACRCVAKSTSLRVVDAKKMIEDLYRDLDHVHVEYFELVAEMAAMIVGAILNRAVKDNTSNQKALIDWYQANPDLRDRIQKAKHNDVWALHLDDPRREIAAAGNILPLDLVPSLLANYGPISELETAALKSVSRALCRAVQNTANTLMLKPEILTLEADELAAFWVRHKQLTSLGLRCLYGANATQLNNLLASIPAEIAARIKELNLSGLSLADGEGVVSLAPFIRLKSLNLDSAGFQDANGSGDPRLVQALFDTLSSEAGIETLNLTRLSLIKDGHGVSLAPFVGLKSLHLNGAQCYDASGSEDTRLVQVLIDTMASKADIEILSLVGLTLADPAHVVSLAGFTGLKSLDLTSANFLNAGEFMDPNQLQAFLYTLPYAAGIETLNLGYVLLANGPHVVSLAGFTGLKVLELMDAKCLNGGFPDALQLQTCLNTLSFAAGTHIESELANVGGRRACCQPGGLHSHEITHFGLREISKPQRFL